MGLLRSSVATTEGRRSPAQPAAAYNRAMRSLLRILLPALAVLAPMIASPAAPSYAETRVWGFELEEPTHVRAQPTLSQTCIEGYPPAYGGLVVGCSPVPRGTAGDALGNYTTDYVMLVFRSLRSDRPPDTRLVWVDVNSGKVTLIERAFGGLLSRDLPLR